MGDGRADLEKLGSRNKHEQLNDDRIRRALSRIEERVRAPMGTPTSTYTDDALARFEDIVLMDPTAGNLIVNVPEPGDEDRGRIIVVKHFSDSTNKVRVRTPAPDVYIDGKTFFELGTRQIATVIAVSKKNYIAILGGGQPLADLQNVPGNPLLNWELINNAGTGPGGRSGAGFVYNPTTDECLMFGGWDGATRKNDTWALVDEKWETVARVGTGAPTARETPIAVFDPIGNRVIVGFGYDNVNPATLYMVSDLYWTTDGNTYTQLVTTNNPSARITTACFDPFTGSAGTLVIFGGKTVGAAAGDQDTWSLDMATLAWTDRSTDPKPPPRGQPNRCAMIYDPIRRHIVMWGGTYNNTLRYQDVWVLNPSTWKWHEVGINSSVKYPTDAGSYEVWLEGGVWCASKNRPLQVGGALSMSVAPTSPRTDALTFDENTDSWRRDDLLPVWDGTTNNYPSYRRRHMVAWDSKRNCAYMYGGWSALTELWRLSL